MALRYYNYRRYLHTVFAFLFAVLYGCSGSQDNTDVPPILDPVVNEPVDQTVQQPATPLGVSAQAGNGQNTIIWQTVDRATFYLLEWSTDDAFSSLKSNTVLAPATQYEHKGLTNGQTIFYRIRAGNTVDNSLPSVVVSGTPVAVVPNNQAPIIQQGALVNVEMDEDNAPRAFNLILNASDAENDPMVWRVSINANNGIAVVNSENTVANITYTASLNSHEADNFTIEVDDNKGGIAHIKIEVSVRPVNDAPTLLNNNLVLSIAEVVKIQSSNLSASDVDNDDAQLLFTVNSVTNGQFEFDTAPGIPITSFTQTQITSGAVLFVHDGSAAVPSYGVTVSDGSANNVEGPVNAIVNFKFAKQLITEALNSINDMSLRNCIQRIANESQFQYVSELMRLICDQKAVDGSITDLSGVELFKNITLVIIKNNDIADITPLTQLKYLQILRLDYNLIADLSALDQFSQSLLELSLQNNLLTDASFVNVNLAELNNLGIHQIDVRNIYSTCVPPQCNNISDLSVFSYISALNILNFRYNSVTDLAALAQLPNLTQIEGRGNLIDNAGITTFNQPGTFPSLQGLFLDSNKIDDVADIALGLRGKKLEYLLLNDNAIGEFNSNPPAGSTGAGSLSLLIPTTAGDATSKIFGIGYPFLGLANNPSIPCELLQSIIDYYSTANRLSQLWPQTIIIPTYCS